jgi:DNA (cytosine-5)-methyltransferase 1
MPTFYEFFAGGGMAREGLGEGWTCLFANDIDEKKAASYRENWGANEILVTDVGKIRLAEIPPAADLVWASFPCQDLSLAGMGAGLKGSRSGTFWPFWKLIRALNAEERGPRLVVLENVCGALTSHVGKDFRSLIGALRAERYRAGALVIDASMFLPHSRPRLFIIGIREYEDFDSSLTVAGPQEPFHTAAVVDAYKGLPSADRDSWLWWNLPVPKPRASRFSDLIEEDIPWHTRAQTHALLDMMSPLNLRKVNAAAAIGRRIVGTIYKRTRRDRVGNKAQRAEVRFDDIAGCLRTPGGGSSRQTILVVEGDQVRSRLLSVREAARLMGLRESYILPANYNDGYHLVGDGLAVPVVRHLARYLLEPLAIEANREAWHAA